MNIKLAEGAVPFVISYRKFLRRPKVKRKKSFVGPAQMAKNIALKLIEFVEDVALETRNEVVDPGESVAVHWAVSVEDPWDLAPGRESNLVAYRMGGDRPPCGAHFEIISSHEETASDQETAEEVSRQPTSWAQIPPKHPLFEKPLASAYRPRQIKPLLEQPLETCDGSDDSGETVDYLKSFGGLEENH